jgi:hypothetical protein
VIGHDSSWSGLKLEEKSKSLTEMFDVVETILFDEKTPTTTQSSPAVSYNVNKSNIGK